jgi:lysophospholipase L1-like esterase
MSKDLKVSTSLACFKFRHLKLGLRTLLIAALFVCNVATCLALPTIFIAGDSTAARGAGENQQGWGEPFANYFDSNKVTISNRARGGRSSRTFLTEGLWEKLLVDVQANDIVLIQFGHNDGGPIDKAPARGSLPGIGDETRDVETKGTNETVHTYGSYLRKFIRDTKSKGATPIVLSTVRNEWKDGRIERGSGRFNGWAYQVARSEKTLFVDLTDIIADQFEKLGADEVKKLYPRDHTHFNAAGADLHAAAVVSGLKGLRPTPIKNFLSTKGEAVAADPISWLQLPFPANQKMPTVFLIGDSTVRNGRGDGSGGQWGWGDFLAKHYDLDKVNIVNRAVGGLSSRTYLTQGHWERVLSLMKPGDFVVMQFGHNDNGSPTNPPPGRASLKGAGAETITFGGETIHTFGWYLGKYIDDARAHGATPIVCSLVPRKIWKDGKIVRAPNTHADWAAQVALEKKTAFMNLYELIAQHYDELGAEKVNALFADEHTHTTAAGAELNADVVANYLKSIPNFPLAIR